MQPKSYFIEEVYQLIKEKYPQYNDDTIVIPKIGNKPVVTFKELTITCLSIPYLKDIGKKFLRSDNINRKIRECYQLNDQKYWRTKLLNLVDLKYCPMCKKIFNKTNFSKNARKCKQCVNINSKNHYKNNKEYYLKRNSTQRKRFVERTPKWVTSKELQAIQEFYNNCPKGYHVDHIIPLNGKNVSGLHVLSNLRYLTAEENRSKSNKYIPKIEFL